MKKLFLLLSMAVATVSYANIHNCTTGAEFREYLAENETQIGRGFYLAYADSLDNPENFTTFNDYLVKTQEYTTAKDKIVNTDISTLAWVILKTQNKLNLNAYQSDAFAYLKEVQSPVLVHYYGDNDFCKSNNISDEERLIAIADYLIDYDYTNEIVKVTRYLVAIQYKISDEIVLEKFKTLYAKYYPQIEKEDDDIAIAITQIAKVLKSRGYNVNK